MNHDIQDRSESITSEDTEQYTTHSTDLQEGKLSGLRKVLAAEAKTKKATSFVGPPHEVVIEQLLNQIGPVNFRLAAEIDPEDEDAKVKKHHYLIIVAEKIIELAKKNDWGLGRRETFFYVYNSAFWVLIDKDEVKDFLRRAAEKMGVEKFQARFYEFTEQLFRQFEVTAMLKKVKADRETIKINLANGTFEITTHKQHLRPPNPADFLTHQLPFAYDPSAEAPMFKNYLDMVLPDVELQNVLAEFAGYVFVSPAKLKLEKALLLYGSGANGKSVFFEIITALLGSENVSHYSLQSLTNEPAYCRANLANKLVNYASEINGKLEADTFKQLCSGEPIEARLPYGQPFIMTDYAKLIFNANELPTDVEHTPAYFRRFLIIPFNVTIPEEKQDKELSAKIIQSELSGVFNWVLDGLRRLLAQGRFTDSDAVRQQIEMYKRQSDTVRLFLDEEGYQKNEQYTPLKDIYREYKSFCLEDNYKPFSNKNFLRQLNTNGIVAQRKNFGWAVYVRKADAPY